MHLNPFHHATHHSHGMIGMITDSIVRSAIYRAVWRVTAGLPIVDTLVLCTGIVLVCVGVRKLLRK